MFNIFIISFSIEKKNYYEINKKNKKKMNKKKEGVKLSGYQRIVIMQF